MNDIQIDKVRIEQIKSRGNRLLRSVDVDRCIRQNRVDACVILYFLKKALGLLGASECLVEKGYEEEAQILTRAIIELRINFQYFLTAGEDDWKRVTVRVLDSVVIEKIKALKAVDYDYGGEPIDKEDWTVIEEDIKKRYTTKEYNAIRKHGFSGLPLEERARRTKNEDWYDSAYRLFSRNVHMADVFETLGASLIPHSFPDYERSRIDSIWAALADSSEVVVSGCCAWFAEQDLEAGDKESTW